MSSYTTTFNLPPSSLGTLAELAVANDLLYKGYSVFRSLTPNGPYDLVACRGRVVKKIEVRMGHRTLSGRVQANRHLQPGATDLAVFVVEDAAIEYYTRRQVESGKR